MDEKPRKARLALLMTLASVLGAVAIGTAWLSSNTVAPFQALLGAAFGHETVYATEYTNKRWRAVQIGMSREEVLSILGAPINRPEWLIDPTLQECWDYSTWRRGGSENYHRREVRFQAGKAVSKTAEFYLD